MASAKRTVLALLLAALAIGFASTATAPARGASRAIDLYGSVLAGWGTSNTSESNPGPTLSVSAGDTVTVTLHSTDGVQHEFLIDYNGNGRADPGEPVSAPFSGTATVTFVAGASGTFPYYCVFHPSAMKGTFVVQGTGGATPSADSMTSGTGLAVLGIVIVVVVAVGVTVLVLRRRTPGP